MEHQKLWIRWRRIIRLAEICLLLRIDVMPASSMLAIALWHPNGSHRPRWSTSVGPAWAAAPSPRRLPTGSPPPSPVGRQRLQPRRIRDAVMRDDAVACWRWSLDHGRAAASRRRGRLDGGTCVSTTLATTMMLPPRCLLQAPTVSSLCEFLSSPLLLCYSCWCPGQ
jgi:hypothetical protein